MGLGLILFLTTMGPVGMVLFGPPPFFRERGETITPFNSIMSSISAVLFLAGAAGALYLYGGI